MNKKESSELRRHMKASDDLYCMDHGAVAYVSNLGDVECIHPFSFATTDSDEYGMYLDILKKAISTKVGKNLIECEFQTNEDSEVRYPGQHMLYGALSANLDEVSCNTVIHHIADHLDYGSSYAIVLANCRYTVFKKDKSGSENPYSDECYHHMICAICPTVNTEGTMEYDPNSRSMKLVYGKSVMSRKPVLGFLYPAFCERSSDVNKVMLYTKDAKEIDYNMAFGVLRAEAGMSAYHEKSAYQQILENGVADELSYTVISAMNDQFVSLIESYKNETDPCLVDCNLLCDMLSTSGVSVTALDRVKAYYKDYCGGISLHAVNLVETKFKLVSGLASASIPCDCGIDVFIRSNEIGLSATEPTISINGMTVDI